MTIARTRKHTATKRFAKSRRLPRLVRLGLRKCFTKPNTRYPDSPRLVATTTRLSLARTEIANTVKKVAMTAYLLTHECDWVVNSTPGIAEILVRNCS